MHKQFDIKKCVLPIFLIIALLLPSTAYAAPDIPAFDGAAVVELNGNMPAFLPEDLVTENYTVYSELDALGRAGPATACISRACLPTELRAESDDVLPVGWKQVRYDDVIDGRYLYSLCHVIAPELSGAGSDPRNIFTGTRYLRTEGMQPFENVIADFLRRTTFHVIYRVTPFYRGDELVPFGVQMEAYSVEDAGKSVCFNVFAYNIQPGVSIDYTGGDSRTDSAVEVTRSGAALIDARLYTLTEGTSLPSVESFEELYKQWLFASGNTIERNLSSESIYTPKTVWIPNNGDPDQKYHEDKTCSGMKHPVERRFESVSKRYEPCHNCWDEAEYNYLMSIYNK